MECDVRVQRAFGQPHVALDLGEGAEFPARPRVEEERAGEVGAAVSIPAGGPAVLRSPHPPDSHRQTVTSPDVDTLLYEEDFFKRAARVGFNLGEQTAGAEERVLVHREEIARAGPQPHVALQ